MFSKMKEKKYEREAKNINHDLDELKFQYETMLEALKAKNRQAEDLIRQLQTILAHVKKRYKEEFGEEYIDINGDRR